MKPTLDRTTLAGLLLVVSLGLAWMAFSWRSTAQAGVAATQAFEAQQVLSRLAALRATAAEAALPEGTDPARSASAEHMAALRTVLAADAEQFSRQVALGVLLARYFDALAAAPEPGRRNAPAAQPADAQRLHERVRAAIDEMRTPAETAATALHQRSQDLAAQARYIVAGGAVVLLGGAALLWLRLRQQRAQLRRAEADRDAEHRAEQEASTVMDRLLDLVPEALGLIDAEGRFESVNAGADALWGWPEGALKGRACVELVAPEDQRRTEQAFAAWMKLAADAPVQQLRNRCKRKDGKLIQVQWRAVWLAEEHQLLFVAHDLTELEALRQQAPELSAAALQAKADAAQAAVQTDAARHLRADALATVGGTLLPAANSVLLNAQVLADGLAGTLTPEQNKRARAMRDTATMLQRYGEELRSLGQAESGSLLLAREAFDVSEAVNKVAATLRVQAQMKGLTLELQLADDLGYARGDTVRFERVLHNVIDWCVRQNSTGRIRVDAALAPPGRMQISVADGGQAEASEHRAHVLDFFAQDAALPQPLATVGDLGLAVSRRLAFAMGGTLDASGTPEGSITFVLALPSDTMGS